MKEMNQKKLYELVGVAKILDILWENSYYSMGKLASDRIKNEMTYYFGKHWEKIMYDLIDKNPGSLLPLKKLTISKGVIE